MRIIRYIVNALGCIRVWLALAVLVGTAIAVRFPRPGETVVFAGVAHLGTSKSTNIRLHTRMRAAAALDRPQPQLGL